MALSSLVCRRQCSRVAVHERHLAPSRPQVKAVIATRVASEIAPAAGEIVWRSGDRLLADGGFRAQDVCGSVLVHEDDCLALVRGGSYLRTRVGVVGVDEHGLVGVGRSALDCELDCFVSHARRACRIP